MGVVFVGRVYQIERLSGKRGDFMPMGSRRNQTDASGRSTRQVRFNVVVTNEPPWYVATCLENSVASQGCSVEKALANLKEALELYYENDEVEAGLLEPSQTFLTTLEVALP